MIKKCRELSEKKDVFIIGGESKYNLFIDYADKMYITEIQDEDNNADAFFPQIDESEWETKIIEENKEKNVKYISVNCMDIINGYSIVVAYNKETADLIQKDLGIQFHNLKRKTKTLESRKEMIKIMREKYSG